MNTPLALTAQIKNPAYNTNQSQQLSLLNFKKKKALYIPYFKETICIFSIYSERRWGLRLLLPYLQQRIYFIF